MGESGSSYSRWKNLRLFVVLLSKRLEQEKHELRLKFERLESSYESRIQELQADLHLLRKELHTAKNAKKSQEENKRETFAGLAEENERLHSDLHKVSLFRCHYVTSRGASGARGPMAYTNSQNCYAVGVILETFGDGVSYLMFHVSGCQSPLLEVLCMKLDPSLDVDFRCSVSWRHDVPLSHALNSAFNGA